jgi:hypothetical protein
LTTWRKACRRYLRLRGFARLNILWYSPHHPLRREQISKFVAIRGNSITLKNINSTLCGASAKYPVILSSNDPGLVELPFYGTGANRHLVLCLPNTECNRHPHQVS